MSKKKSKKIESAKCSFCPRIIVKENEIGGVYYLVNGRRCCMVCRAVNKSKFKKQIKASGSRMRADLKKQNEAFEKEEQERMFEMAAESQKDHERVSK